MYRKEQVKQLRAAKSLAAVVGAVLVVGAGIALASLVGIGDWIGIVIVAFIVGTTTGFIGVSRHVG